jgi:formylglycine-generating enzyme
MKSLHDRPLQWRSRLCLALLIACLSSSPGFASETLNNSLDMRFVRILAGTYVMGNSQMDETAFELPDGDVQRIQDETPPHTVRISRDFWLGATEVTQAQWLRLMGNRPGPAALWRRADWQRLPVVSISWNDAQRFIQKLNAKEKTQAYRLPSEAEWEYAARAGSPDARPFPKEKLNDYAWSIKNSKDEPQPVASKLANAWGLYDMLGNAWEWVADRYHQDYYANAPKADPQGPSSGEQRVRRGGSYHCETHLMRVNYRAADTPDTRYSVLGFRVLRENTQGAN